MKAKRLTHPWLLEQQWDADLPGGDALEEEADSLPPQPEDAMIFYNDCSVRWRVPLHATSAQVTPVEEIGVLHERLTNYRNIF